MVTQHARAAGRHVRTKGHDYKERVKDKIPDDAREAGRHVRRKGHEYKERVKDKIPEDAKHAKRTSTLGLVGRPLRWTITACSVTGFSLFGYDQGLMSGIISSDQFLAEFPGVTSKSAEHESVLQGGVTASYEIGCLFGAFFVLLFGEKVGRKPLITLGCLIIVIGTVISTTAFGPKWGLGQFVIGRVITGLGNGMNTATIPVWQSEVSRPELRGRLVQLEGSVVAVGTMLAYWFDFGLHFINLNEPKTRLASIAWRFPVALQIAFALAVFILLIGLPESPRWLILHNREDEARTVVSRLYDRDEDDELVEEVVASQIADARRAGAAMHFRDLLDRGKGAYMSRCLIGASTQFFQQFSGCNAAIYYATVLFQDMFKATEGGVLTRQKQTLSLIMGGVFASVYALFTIPAFFLVDWMGRRNLFILGATGQAISFFISFGCLVHSTPQTMKGGAVGLYLFIAFFAMSILGLPWIYPPEINPLKTRTAATAVSTCANWLSNFAVVMFTPVFIQYKNWACYLFFALVNCVWLPIIITYYPETAGRSLEEVDIIFARSYVENKLPWRVAAEMPKLDHHEVAQEARRLGISLDVEDDYESTDGSGSGSGSGEGTATGSDSYPQKRRGSYGSSVSELSIDNPQGSEEPLSETPVSDTPAENDDISEKSVPAPEPPTHKPE